MRAVLAAVAAAIALAMPAAAQNVVITHARLIGDDGHVTDNATIVARDGRIVSVGTGAPAAAPAGARRIDARGMVALPAFIDAHRHLVRGAAKDWMDKQAAGDMTAFLAAGFTTVFSMIDDPVVLTLRDRIAAGALPGPRLYAAKLVPLAKGNPQPSMPPPPSPYRDAGRNDPARPPVRPVTAPEGFTDAESRAMVDQAKAEKWDAIKTILILSPGGPESHTLAVIADEARKQGLRTYTHATNYLDSLAAVNAKVDVLAHTPHIGRLEEDMPAVEKIAHAGIPMVSTLQVFVPHFDDKNVPLYRDGGPFPMPRPLSSAGQGPVNARLLWDAGITYAYGTDTQWDPRETLRDELRALSLVFSPRDILRIMGPNAAAAIDKSADLGALAPGKLADIVLVRGNPLDDVFDLLKVALVVKEGRVVVDKLATR